MATKKKKRMRLPNGIGSVHLINDGKRRRNPWRARVPSHIEFNAETGKASHKYINIGYFATETEAIEALFDYRKNPYTIEAAVCTFADVFEMWSKKKFPDVSKSAQGIYNSAYKNSAELHSLKMRDIRAIHMEHIMQTIPVGYQSQAQLKILWGQLFKYAMEHDIVQKNYAQFVQLRDKDTGTKRTAMAKEDIEKLWCEIDKGNPDAEIAMIYIYTGMRATELLEVKKANIDLEARIMIGGKKTEAGKNRRIPIHVCIIPFIKKLMAMPGDFLIMREYKGDMIPMKYQHYNTYHWLPLMKKIGKPEYTMHYTRHTCATLMREANIPEDIKKVILGHKSDDITGRYTHISDKMLLEAIDAMQGRN